MCLHQRIRSVFVLLLTATLFFSLMIPAGYSRVGGAEMAASTSTHSKTARSSSQPTDLAEAQARASSARVSTYFEANRGQTDARVDYIARGAGYTLFLTKTEAVFVLTSQKSRSEIAARMSRQRGAEREREPVGDVAVTKYAVRMKLARANTEPTLSALEELPRKVNY